jgi:hypothetical protein
MISTRLKARMKLRKRIAESELGYTIPPGHKYEPRKMEYNGVRVMSEALNRELDGPAEPATKDVTVYEE